MKICSQFYRDLPTFFSRSAKTIFSLNLSGYDCHVARAYSQRLPNSYAAIAV